MAVTRTMRIQPGACNFLNSETGKAVSVSESLSNAESVISKICSSIALPPKFKLVAVDDPGINAIAEIDGTDRFILYDRAYMSTVSASGLQTWPSLAVIAHEIGHHLCGHTLTTDGSRPPLELEADHFAGFALARMGAAQTDALQLWSSIIPDVVSSTHPPRSQRIDAARSGWIVAVNRSTGQESHTLVSANQNAAGTYDRVLSIWINHQSYWEENQHGHPLARFIEIERGPSSVFLYDASRDMTVRLEFSQTDGIASGYWARGKVTDTLIYWSPLDPFFWPAGMRSSSDAIKN
ncbi:hypothetical protein [Rhizobium sp. F40D2]|uniref:hypothetical protein n=1 Tax=Rhizobium sp. F40D2 TaxID=3453141 RepID=UPI003F238B65